MNHSKSEEEEGNYSHYFHEELGVLQIIVSCGDRESGDSGSCINVGKNL